MRNGLAGKVLLNISDIRDQVEQLAPLKCVVGVPFEAEMIGMVAQHVFKVITSD